MHHRSPIIICCATHIPTFRLVDSVVGWQLSLEILRSHREKWTLSVDFGYPRRISAGIRTDDY
jgi:hypothetical protein